jgi:hypothetical protein
VGKKLIAFVVMFDGFWGKSKKKEVISESPPQMEDGASKFTLPALRLADVAPLVEIGCNC